MQAKGFFKDNRRMQQAVLGGLQGKLQRLLKTEIGLGWAQQLGNWSGSIGLWVKKPGSGRSEYISVSAV